MYQAQDLPSHFSPLSSSIPLPGVKGLHCKSPPSTLITSLVFLTLVPIRKIMRSSVPSPIPSLRNCIFCKAKTTGPVHNPGYLLYALQGLALQNGGGGSGLVLSISAHFSTPFPSLLYHLSLGFFLKGIIFRLGDISSLEGFVCQ